MSSDFPQAACSGAVTEHRLTRVAGTGYAPRLVSASVQRAAPTLSTTAGHRHVYALNRLAVDGSTSSRETTPASEIARRLVDVLRTDYASRDNVSGAVGDRSIRALWKHKPCANECRRTPKRVRSRGSAVDGIANTDHHATGFGR